MRLELKRIDKARIPTTGKWMVYDTTEDGPARVSEAKLKGRYAEYAEYAFIVRRKIQQSPGSDVPTITTTILIQSDCLKQALKLVMKDVRNLSWNAQPFKVIIPIHPEMDADDNTGCTSTTPRVSPQVEGSSIDSGLERHPAW